MSFFPIKFQTDDGYTFFILYSGRVVDSLDPETVDMSWPDVKSFFNSQASKQPKDLNSCKRHAGKI